MSCDFMISHLSSGQCHPAARLIKNAVKSCASFFLCRREVTVVHPQPTPDLPLITDTETDASYDENNGKMVPPEILLMIFELLDDEDLANVRKVCRLWENLSGDSLLLYKRINASAFTQLGMIQITSPQQQPVIPRLIDKWRQELSTHIATTPIVNGLSLLSIPAQWKQSPHIPPEDKTLIVSIFNQTLFAAVTRSALHVDDMDEAIVFYADNRNPTQFSADFCAALCEGIALDRRFNALKITSENLGDAEVTAIAANLPRGMKFLSLAGNFTETGVEAVIDALSRFASDEEVVEEEAQDPGEEVIDMFGEETKPRIDLIAADCSRAKQQEFMDALRDNNLEGSLLVKSQSSLYSY